MQADAPNAVITIAGIVALISLALGLAFGAAYDPITSRIGGRPAIPFFLFLRQTAMWVRKWRFRWLIRAAFVGDAD